MPTPHNDEIKEVLSYPAKAFFVSMLTRDIDLADAILDLLDNCVDGAIRSRSSDKQREDSFDDFCAEITFREDRFTIEDNCGGISWEIAKNSAFRMGRPEKTEFEEKGMIGVVGIGMKRAIFKMGRECFVHSNHKDDAFLVTIPEAWFKDDDNWEPFNAERERPLKRSKHGTIIEISKLEQPVKLAFSEGSSFRTTFPTIVAESYSYLIEKGFKVKINGDEVKRRPVKICFEQAPEPRSKQQLIRPYIYKGQFGEVSVFIVVGYRSRMATQEEQNDEAKSSYAAREAGWTIVCNDRVVLSNDRSIKTGWGFGGVPNFHSQFSCIAGIVEFKSANTADLPVTTTKRGIDTGKDIYILVRERMQEGLKIFTRNTNRWKGSESELKGRFDKLKFIDLQELKTLAARLSFTGVKGDGEQKQYMPQLPEKKADDDSKRRISYTKEIADIEIVSRILFNEIRHPNKVGETCFDRVLKGASK